MRFTVYNACIRALEYSKEPAEQGGVHTIKQGPYENKRKNVILPWIRQFSQASWEVLSRISPAVDGMDTDGGQQSCSDEQDETGPIV